MTVNLDSQRAQLLTIRIGDRDDRALCIVHARRGEDQHGYHDFQLELQFQPGIGGRFTNVQLEVKLRAPGQPDRPIQFSYFPNSTVSPKETEEGKLQDLDTYIDRSIRGRYREYARPTFSEHMAVQFKRSIRTSGFKLQSSGMSMPLPLGITKNQKRVYLKISRQKWGATVLTLSLIKSICRQLLDTKAAGLSS
ncbi:hypothetical protein BDN72DRAFT_628803 [Pluteus cervinus]|uniref:Uncharacterized protein n=1 Tax=Pluteus cervinus TaxID=181527 RepID=A0ACD3B9X4_9AGAR|nr:hypothetical protein BDN72DRAFT_628803 [Pluteus cervinus]